MQKYNVLAEVELHDRIFGAGTTVELEAEVAEPLVNEGKLSLVAESNQLGVDPALEGAEKTKTATVENGEVNTVASESVEESQANVAAAEGAADTAAAEQAADVTAEAEVKAEEKAEEASQGAGWMGNHTV